MQALEVIHSSLHTSRNRSHVVDRVGVVGTKWAVSVVVVMGKASVVKQ